MLVSLVLLLPWGGSRLDAARIAPLSPPAGGYRKPAPGMFLVAARSFLDPYFSRTVIYLLQHDSHATFGVIVNHPLPGKLSKRLPRADGTALGSRPLYDGGPVNPEMLVTVIEHHVWQNNYDAALLRHVVDGVFASVNPLIVDTLLRETDPPIERARFYFGHVGWVPGQLEQELDHHDWHLMEGNTREVFARDAGALWKRLIERLEPAEPLLSPEIPLNPGGQ